MNKQQLVARIKARSDDAYRIAQAAEATGGYTESDRQAIKRLFEEAKGCKAQLEGLKADDDVRRQLDELGESLGFTSSRSAPGGGLIRHAWAEAVTQFNTNLAGPLAKELVPSGAVVVRLPEPELVQMTSPVRRLRQLIALLDAPGGHYRYLEQTSREWNAAAVPAGEQKPQSKVGLTLREGQAPVVATLSEGIDRFLLSDFPALQTFVGSELQQAVETAIEAAAMGELAAAGFDSVPFAVDGLTTIRRAIGVLENRGVTASAAVVNPDDWTDIETSRTTTEDFILRPDAPLNVLTRRAWGMPVVTTVACPKGTAYVGDWSNAARFFGADRGAVRLDWSEAHMDRFELNEVTFRCETRVKLAILLLPAFVTVAIGQGGTGGGDTRTAAPAQSAAKKP